MSAKKSVKRPVQRKPLTELEQWEQKLRAMKAAGASKDDIRAVEDRIRFTKRELEK